MINWNTDFHNISINYEEKAVHIKTDIHLLNFLAQSQNSSLQLADYILNQYQALYGKSLQITNYSLAIEILAHVYADIFSKILLTLGPPTKNPLIQRAIKLLHTLQSKTEIIDCGEISVDNNRVIWDALVPYHTTIFALCSNQA